jgi:hypothetical protein
MERCLSLVKLHRCSITFIFIILFKVDFFNICTSCVYFDFVGPVGTRIVALNPSFANFILFELISHWVMFFLLL